ncbi:MAG: signal peptidase II [Acidobacteriaceae bacterium]
MRRYILLIAAAVVILDRWTKHLVESRLALYTGFDVVPGFFRITHTLNAGAAFGMFSESVSPYRTAGLIAFTAIALLVVLTLIWRAPKHWTFSAVALGLILGGAVGNFYDRVRYHEVTDFLLFFYQRHEFPVFNIADSAITVGAILMIVELLFVKTPPDLPKSETVLNGDER